MFNATSNIELINHFTIVLDPKVHALAYSKKLIELRKRNLTEDEIAEVMKEPVQMEMYYDSDTDSLFALESLALDNLDESYIYVPYSGETFDEPYFYNGIQKIGSFKDEINSIVSAYGDINFGELEVESSPLYEETETSISLVEGINLNKLLVVVYSKKTDEEINSFVVDLDDVDLYDLVEQIHRIALDWVEYKKEEN